MDRLSEMEAFAAVVDQGGFTGAAAKLGISKSAVSKHVSSLEGRLGARLLNRTTRRVNPTEIGLVYYDRARGVLAAATEADSTVSTLQADPAGSLEVVAPSDFGTAVLSPLISEFLQRYSEVEVNLVLTDRPAELMSEEHDLSLRLGAQPDSTLTSTKLTTFQRFIVASPEYLQTEGVPKRIEDLAQHRLLHFHDGGQDKGWRLISQTGETRVIRTGGRLVANSGACLRENVIKGLGLAFLPDFVVGEDIDAGRLVNVMPHLPFQPLPLYAACPTKRAVLPRVRAFVEYLGEIYAGQTMVRRAIA